MVPFGRQVCGLLPWLNRSYPLAFRLGSYQIRWRKGIRGRPPFRSAARIVRAAPGPSLSEKGRREPTFAHSFDRLPN